MSTTKWVGPERNPLLAAQMVSDDPEIQAKLQSCVIGLFNWHSIDPRDNILEYLLQEIAGDTNIVVQYRDSGWYATLDVQGDSEHPTFTRWDWVQRVAQRGTLLGYWEWVKARVEGDEYA